jgi:PAS domain S-box-containing protein
MENTKHRILLVEDDKLDQMAFERLVQQQKLPYDCTMAESVAEAKRLLAREKFDVVICDYELADGVAFDIFDSVKNTPIVLITGVGDEELAVKAWKAGASDYLIKDQLRNYLKALPVTVENVISHRKTAEQLRLLSKAVVCADDSVYITDTENKIIFVNDVFCDTYRCKKEDILGKDSNILWAKNPPQSRQTDAFQSASCWDIGFFHKRTDGSIFPVSISRSDIKDENGDEIAHVVIARDVSERIRLEEELRRENSELAEQNRLKNQLVLQLAEQLKTPLMDLKNIVSNTRAGDASVSDSQLPNNLKSAEEKLDKLEAVVTNFLGVFQSYSHEDELCGSAPEKTEENMSPL